MTGSPVRRVSWRKSQQTVRNGHAAVTMPDIWIAMLVAYLVPTLLAFGVARVPGFEILSMFGLGAFFAPFVLPFGVLAGLYALKKGWAGWAIALLAGGLAAHLFIVLIVVGDDSPIAFVKIQTHIAGGVIAPVGMVYAFLLWITLFLRRRSAFVSD
ncbi:MAG: hypothetical protein AB8B82_11025 [Roseovarius sp.]